MMKEDEILKNKYGNTRPFKVPEGYFETLEDRVMTAIPHEQHPKCVQIKVHRPLYLRPYAWISATAAIVIGFLFIISSPITDMSDADKYASSDNGIDNVYECAMLDNDDVYAYFSGE